MYNLYFSSWWLTRIVSFEHDLNGSVVGAEDCTLFLHPIYVFTYSQIDARISWLGTPPTGTDERDENGLAICVVLDDGPATVSLAAVTTTGIHVASTDLCVRIHTSRVGDSFICDGTLVERYDRNIYLSQIGAAYSVENASSISKHADKSAWNWTFNSTVNPDDTLGISDTVFQTKDCDIIDTIGGDLVILVWIYLCNCCDGAIGKLCSPGVIDAAMGSCDAPGC